jgi:hypothetical protein
MDTNILLGSFVKTKRCGHRGVVIAKHLSFTATGSSDEWFDSQRPRIIEVEKNYPWVDILCEEYGSIRVPISDCQMVSPFWLSNPLVEFYWGKVIWKPQKPGTIAPPKIFTKSRMLRVEHGEV